MWLLFLYGYLTLRAWAFQQLIEPSPSRYFTSIDSYSFASNILSTTRYTTSYALTAWINFHALPASDSQFLSIEANPGFSGLFCGFNTDGSITVYVQQFDALNALSITGITLHEWAHIGIGLNYNIRQVWVSLISWAGVQVVQTLALDFTLSLPTAVLLSITIGGLGSPVDMLEMADARYYASSLTVADMLAISGAGTCEVEDLGMVPKLTMQHCQYIQIYSRSSIINQNAGAYAYIFPYSRLDTSYSATMWIWFTETTPVTYRTIFRLTQTSGDSGTLGDRVMSVFLYGATDPNRLEFFSDNPTTINQSGMLNLPVRTM